MTPDRLHIALAVAFLATVACGSEAPSSPDASGVVDGAPDAESDAGASDLFVVSGDCGVLDTELTDSAASDFRNAIAFDHAYTSADEPLLSPGGQEILTDGNAGGDSIFSEIFAFEVLDTCEMLTLLKTENEIVYDGPSKKTDFLAEIDSVRIGVSVTRAQTFPLGEAMTIMRATELLEDKLGDILESTANVSAADAWAKQILAVMIYNRQHLESLEAALLLVEPSIRADTIVWLTVTDGPDDFIYQ